LSLALFLFVLLSFFFFFLFFLLIWVFWADLKPGLPMESGRPLVVFNLGFITAPVKGNSKKKKKNKRTKRKKKLKKNTKTSCKPQTLTTCVNPKLPNTSNNLAVFFLFFGQARLVKVAGGLDEVRGAGLGLAGDIGGVGGGEVVGLLGFRDMKAGVVFHPREIGHKGGLFLQHRIPGKAGKKGMGLNLFQPPFGPQPILGLRQQLLNQIFPVLRDVGT
jgi:hypothetical protein